MPQESTSYEVGYGRPPQHSQFKKGLTGNPKGRPKSSKNTAIILEAMLSERVAIRIDGISTKMSRRDW